MVLDPRFSEAAAAFRRFFLELREAFLERETLLTQLELALLCREHVLVIGPPGTAKSAIVGATLGRLIDETTGKPSLFSKQLAENTVQTDLIGPVDFKVLTETGRTEHLTDEGMLGATHAFLDEVFDGRDMLLRSILNVLHERELKHGRRVTRGLCECAVMTSNRYLSEVLQRSPETLQAFADRISFICFTPKSFARKDSRTQMLWRAQGGQRAALHERLTLQQLDALQAAVEQVEVPALVHEGLEALTDAVEKELLAQVTRLPDYVPTKYFSQRSIVKALWALKAAVVRDKLYRRHDRRLQAEPGDLDMLRYFFLLGGPPPKDLEPLLKEASDPRERAQLEIIRVEHRAFDTALQKILPGLAQGAAREASGVTREEAATADGLSRNWAPAVAATLATSLRSRLVPGPRHPEVRQALVRLADAVAAALEVRLAQGADASEGRGGLSLLVSVLEALELVRRVPELAPRHARVARAAVTFGRQALELIALQAEGAEFDDSLKVEALAGMATLHAEALAKVIEVLQVAALVEPDARAVVDIQAPVMKVRVAQALRRRAERLYGPDSAEALQGDAFDRLALEGGKLRELEAALVLLDPTLRGVRSDLLGPLGARWARDMLGAAGPMRVAQLAQLAQTIADGLSREGLEPTYALVALVPALEQRIAEVSQALSQRAAPVPPVAAQARGGEAYPEYLRLVSAAVDGELLGLRQLEELLKPGHVGLAPALRLAVAQSELSSLGSRVKWLSAWLAQVLAGLPKSEAVHSVAVADQAFDGLVKSRFPLLVTREGELLRLDAAAQRMADEPGAVGSEARALSGRIAALAADFQAYARLGARRAGGALAAGRAHGRTAPSAAQGAPRRAPGRTGTDARAGGAGAPALPLPGAGARAPPRGGAGARSGGGWRAHLRRRSPLAHPGRGRRAGGRAGVGVDGPRPGGRRGVQRGPARRRGAPVPARAAAGAAVGPGARLRPALGRRAGGGHLRGAGGPGALRAAAEPRGLAPAPRLSARGRRRVPGGAGAHAGRRHVLAQARPGPGA